MKIKNCCVLVGMLAGCGDAVDESVHTATIPSVASLPTVSTCMQDLAAGRNVIPGRFIVGLRRDKIALGAASRELALRSKVAIRNPMDLATAHAVAVDLTELEVGQLRVDADVAYVEPDGLACAFDAQAEDDVTDTENTEDTRGNGRPRTSSCASGTSETVPTGISEIGATSRVHSGALVRVAVVDTGIDLDHPDLAANVLGGKGFVGNTTGDDDNGHGSHVAGTIAAVGGNSKGVIGVAPGAGLLAVKVLDRRGSGSYSAIAEGIDWAVQQGADVINMSLGGTLDSATLRTSIENARSAGVFMAVAAGNEGTLASQTYPAAYDTAVITVSAEDPATNGFPSWSNYGVPPIDLAGPGVSICSTSKSGGYAVKSGTSMATPHVAGAAALVLEGTPVVDPFVLRDQLVAGAIALGDTALHTEDLVNAAGL